MRVRVYCCGDGPDGCSWDGKGYHCRGATWGGCGRTFSSFTGFKIHRKSDDICLDPATVGLVLDDGKWRHPAPENAALFGQVYRTQSS